MPSQTFAPLAGVRIIRKCMLILRDLGHAVNAVKLMVAKIGWRQDRGRPCRAHPGDFCYNGWVEQHDLGPTADFPSSAAAWQGRVDSETALGACIDALGILPLRGRAPALLDVRAPGVTLAEAW